MSTHFSFRTPFGLDTPAQKTGLDTPRKHERFTERLWTQGLTAALEAEIRSPLSLDLFEGAAKQSKCLEIPEQEMTPERWNRKSPLEQALFCLEKGQTLDSLADFPHEPFMFTPQTRTAYKESLPPSPKVSEAHLIPENSPSSKNRAGSHHRSKSSESFYSPSSNSTSSSQFSPFSSGGSEFQPEPIKPKIKTPQYSQKPDQDNRKQAVFQQQSNIQRGIRHDKGVIKAYLEVCKQYGRKESPHVIRNAFMKATGFDVPDTTCRRWRNQYWRKRV